MRKKRLTFSIGGARQKMWRISTIKTEEFTNCLSNDVRTFVTDKKPETLSDAARLADNFSLTHKFSTTGIKSNMSPSPRGNNLAFDNKRLPPPRQFQGRYPGNDFSSFNNKPRNGTQKILA